MTTADLLVGVFDYVRDTVRSAVDGLTRDELGLRVDAEANTVGWLCWHLTRVQDDHLSAVADLEQVWTGEGWSERFALPVEVGDIGYGHSSDQVASVVVDAEKLVGYADAVHRRSVGYLRTLTDDDLDRIVDEAWDPPVTLGVRLTSVVNDTLQHAGQAAFLRGIVERRR